MQRRAEKEVRQGFGTEGLLSRAIAHIVKSEAFIKLFFSLVLLIVLSGLTMLAAYFDSPTLMSMIALWGSLAVVAAAFENGLLRAGGWLVLLVFLIGVSTYFRSLFGEVIVVDDINSYAVERIRKGRKYLYVDGQNQERSLTVNGGVYVHNKLATSLRLYEVTYGTGMLFWNEEAKKTLALISAHSVENINQYPSFILEAPPKFISVKKSDGSKVHKRTVLEVMGK